MTTGYFTASLYDLLDLYQAESGLLSENQRRIFVVVDFYLSPIRLRPQQRRESKKLYSAIKEDLIKTQKVEQYQYTISNIVILFFTK